MDVASAAIDVASAAMDFTSSVLQWTSPIYVTSATNNVSMQLNIIELHWPDIASTAIDAAC
jgi:hypothetical protein